MSDLIRVNKSDSYIAISRIHLQDKQLSLKAKGLMTLMLSLPEEWDFSVEGLVALGSDKETAVNNALKELKQAGYLFVKKLTPKDTLSGRYEYVYDLYEVPQKQGIGFLPLEIQALENQNNTPLSPLHPSIPLTTNNKSNKSIYNNNIYNNINNKNNKNNNINNNTSTAKRFIPPTIEEVRAYCEERKNDIDPEAFIDHYTGNGWKVGKNPMKDWRAAVRQWERNDYSSGRKPKQQQFANKSFDTSDLEALFASDLESIVKDGEKNGV